MKLSAAFFCVQFTKFLKRNGPLGCSAVPKIIAPTEAEIFLKIPGMES